MASTLTLSEHLPPHLENEVVTQTTQKGPWQTQQPPSVGKGSDRLTLSAEGKIHRMAIKSGNVCNT